MSGRIIVVTVPSDGITVTTSAAGITVKRAGLGVSESLTIAHRDVASVIRAMAEASDSMRGFRQVSESTRQELRKIAAILGVESAY